MNKMQKKMRAFRNVLLVTALIGILCFSMTIYAAQGDVEKATTQKNEIVTGYRDMKDIDTSFANVPISGLPQYKGTIPTSYSSSTEVAVDVDVQKDYVTSTKDQGLTNVCWAYSAISMAETSYIINEGKTSSSINKDTVDFNEYHLVHYTYNTPEDPLGLFGGDYDDICYGYSDLEVGGNHFFSLLAFANWIGASDDILIREDNVGEEHSDELAFEDGAHLESGYILTMPDMESSNYQTDMSIIKQMIMNYGSVGIGYYSNVDIYDSIGSGNELEGYYYYPEEEVGNHAVTIVGWDDEIPASAFQSTPAGDGAWLVKNSWGTVGDMEGYFWLSYYDKTIDKNAVAYNFVSSGNYDNNYQYDGSLADLVIGSTNSISEANVFVADSYETVEAVGVFVEDINVDYEVRIYKNLSETEAPQDGELALKQTGSLAYAGFHTIDLKDSINVKEGERYAVVVTLSVDSGLVHAVLSGAYDGGWIQGETYARAGESYVGASLEDLYDLNEFNYDYAEGYNIKIKSFTNEAEVVETIERASDNKIYYHINGEIIYDYTGWKTLDNNQYYIKAGKAATGWLQINNKWYYFDSNAMMQTGWQYVGNKWYYLNKKGVMQTGWQYIGKKYYYLDASGAMKTGWLQLGKTWYYLDKNGVMQTGWIQLGKTWYYLDASGAMKTGWLQLGKNWYYLDASGAMKTGWVQLWKTWYYLDTSGAMKTGWLQSGKTWYYLDASGAMKTGWLQLGSNWYYMNSSGAMLTGWQKIGGTWYYFNSGGVWIP